MVDEPAFFMLLLHQIRGSWRQDTSTVRTSRPTFGGAADAVVRRRVGPRRRRAAFAGMARARSMSPGYYDALKKRTILGTL